MLLYINTIPQNNSAKNSEQQIKIQNLHILFQQLCFAYGSHGSLGACPRIEHFPKPNHSAREV